MAVSNEIFMLGLSLVIYVAMAITWDFQLFSAKKEAGKDANNNAIKMLIVWLVIWLQPLLIQMAILYATASSASSNMLTLYTTYYQVSIYIGWVVSTIFILFFGYNILLWLSGSGSK
jgi:hypothetical protein